MTDGLPNWFTDPPLTAPGPGRFLMTTHKYPLFYLQITKCGSSFMRNLLYYLDHGTVHPAGSMVHSFNQDFVKADLIPEQTLIASPYLFTIVRDPVDRFLSLYFDKIANLTNEKDAAIRRRVVRKAEIDLHPDMTLAEHQTAALKIIDWFDMNLERNLPGKINPHWQRQQERLRRINALSPRRVTLDGLPWQLPALLGPLIPGIADHMAVVRVRNRSKKPFSHAEIATPALVNRIHQVYAQDLQTYEQVRAEWGEGPQENG